MLYQFICKICEHLQEEVFPAVEYDYRVKDDGQLKRVKCESCKAVKLYRYIGTAPSVLGGTNGYQSMERYWAQRPDLRRKHEDMMRKENEERHKKFKNEAIKRQKEGEQIGPIRSDQRKSDET